RYAAEDPDLPVDDGRGGRLEAVYILDSLLRTLVACRSGLQLRIGQVTEALVVLGRHQETGYSRVVDYCREAFDLGVDTLDRWRWLARGLEKFPILSSQFRAGSLHEGHANLLLPFLRQHPDQEAYRVEQATRLTVHQLKAELQVEPEPEQLLTVTFPLTPEEYAKWADSQELARRVAGAPVCQAEVLEMMAVGFLHVFPAPDMEVPVPDRRRIPRRNELERNAEANAHWHEWLDNRPRRLELLTGEIPPDADGQETLAMELLESYRLLRVTIGRLLWWMADLCWPTFESVGHYARERLGMSHSSARQYVAREQVMRHHPVLREAVLKGALSLSRLDLLMPLIARGVSLEPWIDFAMESTCDYLRTWVRTLCDLSRTSPEAFQEWRSQPPGQFDRPSAARKLGREKRVREQVREAARLSLAWMSTMQMARTLFEGGLVSPFNPVAAAGVVLFDFLTCQMLQPDVELIPLRIRLTPEVYRLVALAQAAAQELAGEFLDPGARLQCLMLAFRLEHEGKEGVKGQRKRLLERDEYHCSVPGCTCRKDLQAHHIQFRSQNGSDEDENQTMICVFCHGLVHREQLKIQGLPPGSLEVTRVNGERFVGQRRVCARGGIPLNGWRTWVAPPAHPLPVVTVE
ncbi:MAG: HNH endonuclease signature motif containing protein, partial [Candidatus Eremiobacterota bacterium]